MWPLLCLFTDRPGKQWALLCPARDPYCSVKYCQLPWTTTSQYHFWLPACLQRLLYPRPEQRTGVCPAGPVCWPRGGVWRADREAVGGHHDDLEHPAKPWKGLQEVLSPSTEPWRDAGCLPHASFKEGAGAVLPEFWDSNGPFFNRYRYSDLHVFSLLLLWFIMFPPNEMCSCALMSDMLWLFLLIYVYNLMSLYFLFLISFNFTL